MKDIQILNIPNIDPVPAYVTRIGITQVAPSGLNKCDFSTFSVQDIRTFHIFFQRAYVLNRNSCNSFRHWSDSLRTWAGREEEGAVGGEEEGGRRRKGKEEGEKAGGGVGLPQDTFWNFCAETGSAACPLDELSSLNFPEILFLSLCVLPWVLKTKY